MAYQQCYCQSIAGNTVFYLLVPVFFVMKIVIFTFHDLEGKYMLHSLYFQYANY